MSFSPGASSIFWPPALCPLPTGTQCPLSSPAGTRIRHDGGCAPPRMVLPWHLQWAMWTGRGDEPVAHPHPGTKSFLLLLDSAIPSQVLPVNIHCPVSVHRMITLVSPPPCPSLVGHFCAARITRKSFFLRVSMGRAWGCCAVWDAARFCAYFLATLSTRKEARLA